MKQQQTMANFGNILQKLLAIATAITYDWTLCVTVSLRLIYTSIFSA